MERKPPEQIWDEAPIVEDLVEWLLDRSDFGGGPASSEMRGALLAAFDRGASATPAPEARPAIIEECAKVCDDRAADTEQRAMEERGYWIPELEAVFMAQKELARDIRALVQPLPQSLPEGDKP